MGANNIIEEALMELIEGELIDNIFASDIIKKVGVSKKTFYKYYCDKYDLLTSCFEKHFYSKLDDEAGLAVFLGSYAEQIEKMRKKVLNAFRSVDVNSLAVYNAKFISEFIIKHCGRSDERIRRLAEVYGELVTMETIQWLQWNDDRKVGRTEFVSFMIDSMPFPLKQSLDRSVA